MPLAHAISIDPVRPPTLRGPRDALFHTLVSPRGSRPSSPASLSPTSPTPRRRSSWLSAGRAVHALLIFASVALLLLTALMSVPNSEVYEWRKTGCPTKVLDMNDGMNATLQAAHAAGLVPPDLGRPIDRQPRTAIVNVVRFHTEVLASLVYHFTKLNHNVTVFARDDGLGIDAVIHPFHWRGFKRFERFYASFYEFDVVIMATYPTCHLDLMANLVGAGLPQRYLAVVHNPELLAHDAAAATLVAALGQVQLLTITPHVNAYSNAIVEAEGLSSMVAPSEWYAPIFPVLFPEDCGRLDATLRSPSGAAADQPACNRSAVWGAGVGNAEVARVQQQQAAVAAAAAGSIFGRFVRRQEAQIAVGVEDYGGGDSSDEEGLTEEGGASARLLRQSFRRRRPLAEDQPLDDRSSTVFPRRRGFCVQGKLDPSRRDYSTLFAEIRERRASLVKRGFSLVLQGKGGGRFGAEVLQIPADLEKDGLIKHYASLPFQEYYETLHSCLAILPAFASDAYYLYKGSSSVAASIIAGTPLIATPRLLAAYSFLDASAVFLVPDGTSDVDAMAAVMAAPIELVEAKLAALRALRLQLYDRNLEVLQRLLGEQYLYKRTMAGEEMPSELIFEADSSSSNLFDTSDPAAVMWYGMSTSPSLWTAEAPPSKAKN